MLNRAASAKDRLKKLLLFSCALFAALALCRPGTGRCEGKKKLTVMVYMCGSNLESGYGYATRDLQEMMESGFPMDEVNLLVMTGGSSRWTLHPDQAGNEILQIGRGRQRTVRQAEQMNMGDSATLTSLLAFGRENYPAERYALILWDHGGGPMEGACWDELFSLDNLSLDEITEGIRNAGYPEKLSWIGFDACLMSSLEVASALSPYAEYMIASQETEPSCGWNYAFLKDLGTDAAGADTGRRIVETYFEGQEDTGDILTMACLDLSGTAGVVDAMDAFFTDSSLPVTEGTFALLSGARGSAAGFGKAVKAGGEDGYDLVDAKGLITSLRGEGAAAARLLQALDAMVVCSRSNEDGADGVSLYHPYANKQKYAGVWREGYERLHFSAGYAAYIRAFGDVLLGGEITDWSGVTASGAEEENRFTLQLTEEQRENFDSAQLLVMYDLSESGGLEDHCGLIYTGKAEMDENGLVSASYSGRSLFIEAEDGTLYGPVDFDLTEDGQLACRQMIYLPEGVTDTNQYGFVMYYLEAEGAAEYPEIVRTRVWDPVTETHTSRIAFDESAFGFLHLLEYGRIRPEADGRGLLPAYGTWEMGEVLIGGTELRLPNRWRFRWVGRQMTGHQLYAVFQITDVQQNTFCSQPVPVRNPNLSNYTGTLETDTRGVRLGLAAQVADAELDRGVRFTFTAEAEPGLSARCDFSELTVNGERVCASGSRHSFTFGEENPEPFGWTMEGKEFFGLDTIETVSVMMHMNDGERIRDIPVTFRFDPVDVSALSAGTDVLGEAEQDGVTLRVLGFSPSSKDSFSVSVLFRNDNPWDVKTEKTITFGKYELYGYGGGSSIPAGRSRLVTYTPLNGTSLSGTELATIGEDPHRQFTKVSTRLLQRRGIPAVPEMTFYIDMNVSKAGSYDIPVPVRLEKPWTIREGMDLSDLNTAVTVQDPLDDPDAPAERVLLAENNQYAVYLEKILAGFNGAALSLEIENRTDVPLTVYAKNASLNGAAVQLKDWDERGRWTVAPRAVRIAALAVALEDADKIPAAWETIGIGFESGEQRGQGKEGADLTLALREPVPAGTFHPAWLSPDRADVQPAAMADVEIPEKAVPEPEVVRTTEQLLDDAVSMPENAGEWIRRIPVNLTAEQAEQAERVFLSLVRIHPEKKALEMISLQRCGQNEDGEFFADCPGLLLVPESARDAFLLNMQEWPEADRSRLEIMTMVGVRGIDSYGQAMQTATAFTVQADYTENTAAVTDAAIEETEPGGMAEACVYMYLKILPEDTDSIMPSLVELPGADGYYRHSVSLQGEPLRFMLRPVAPEDEIYAVFIVVNRDGTQYSLPKIPYPAG